MKKLIKKFNGKNVLITGGTGFIGSHLVKALKDFCGATVLAYPDKMEGVKSIIVDLRDEKDVLKKTKGLDCDVVFHMAGHMELPGKVDAEKHLAINAGGTKNILEACRKKDIERFIYSSSMTVFGDALYLPVDEKHPKIPDSFYGMSKLLGEIYCYEYRRFYGINTVILRYSYVFGPKQYEGRVVPIFINNALKKKPLQVKGSGTSSQDFVYIKDVVNANILAACRKGAVGGEFNIGSGKDTTINELAHTVKKIIPSARIIHSSAKNEVIKRFVFDISKARNVLGYKPNYSLYNGLVEQIEYAKHAKSV
jgi:UDP-glucose 4-epimerase